VETIIKQPKDVLKLY